MESKLKLVKSKLQAYTYAYDRNKLLNKTTSLTKFCKRLDMSLEDINNSINNNPN
jgi:hypothetical protein